MRIIRTYDLSFKHSVCQEYMRGGISKSGLQDRYGILGKTTLLNWLRNLGYLPSSIKNDHSPVVLAPSSTKESVEIRALKAKLQDAELKLEAYRRMIAIAEERFKIDIEKKSVTK